MKKYLVYFVALIALVGCKGFQKSDLQLDGDCLIESVTLNDSIKGQIDLAQRTINFVLPEVYSNDSMVVSELVLSKGAKATINTGDALCLREPRVVRVENGNTYIDWQWVTRNERAQILSFKINDIYTGIIGKDNNILVYIPDGLDIKALVPTVELSTDATISPMVNVATDFSEPVTYIVTNGSALRIYTVTVIQVDKPEALFVGIPATMNELTPEEMAACLVMLSNVPNSLYASFDDLRNKTIDISNCKVMWWHFHRDGGVSNEVAFELYGAKALDCKTVLQDYLDNGGSLLLTRYATFLPAYMSIAGEAASGRFPNNCWGGDEANAEETGGPWSFFAKEGQEDHPLYEGVIENGNEIFTCEAGYRITNSTAQWHMGTDWGGYPDHAYFTKKTKATILGHGGDNAISVWEWARTEKNGGILCIGSGCLDYYSIDEVYEGRHSNVDKMTLNAINYLKK